MINLLPPDVKTGYRYARLNVNLRKWVIMLVIALIGLGVLATYGLLNLKQSSNRYDKTIADAKLSLQKEHYADTQKQVEDISSSFKLVVNVLGQEVLFSQLLKQIGATIPTNSNLTGLTINQLQGGIDIAANATDYHTATQVQVNLADPTNKIFSKADIVSINCSANGSGVSKQFPCSVNLRALFAKDNPYLFINSKGKK